VYVYVCVCVCVIHNNDMQDLVRSFTFLQDQGGKFISCKIIYKISCVNLTIKESCKIVQDLMDLARFLPSFARLFCLGRIISEAQSKHPYWGTE